jgi:hypothetical protein
MMARAIRVDTRIVQETFIYPDTPSAIPQAKTTSAFVAADAMTPTPAEARVTVAITEPGTQRAGVTR